MHRISTSIDITATAEQIWAVLMDLSAYPAESFRSQCFRIYYAWQ